jgi:hypothetical protein
LDWFRYHVAALASACRALKLRADQLRRDRPPEKCHQVNVIKSGTILQHWEHAMSIFGKIMGAIFGSHASATPAGSGAAPAGSAPASGAAPASTGSSPAAPAQSVDVADIVDKAAAAKGEKLAWRTSIVDLMKALDIDSSLTARKELAKELGYTGDTNDSATMNIWLHKQVMAKLAANGGKLPPDIKH